VFDFNPFKSAPNPDDFGRMLRSTSDMVWAKLPPEAQMSRLPEEPAPAPGPRSEQEYDPFLSYGPEFWDENYSSKMGPEWCDEMTELNREWAADAAMNKTDSCKEYWAKRADKQCHGRDPSLKNGESAKGMSPEDCMRYWAEGRPGGMDTTGKMDAKAST